jgi:hypothetical protein
MSKVHAVRLSETEEKLVQEFLKGNPFFDFSTLTRIAVLRFIEKPELSLKPVKKDKQVQKKRRDSHVSV